VERIAVALFERKVEIDPRSLLVFLKPNSDADRGLAARQDDRGLSYIPKPMIMDPGQALADLHRKVQSGRVQMTAIRCNRSSFGAAR
jgi:hypothetical protein